MAGPTHICERMFVDGLGVFILASEQCFKELEDAISIYEQASREKLNLRKSIVIPLNMEQIPQWIQDKDCQI